MTLYPHKNLPAITNNGDCALDIRFSDSPSKELSSIIIRIREKILQLKLSGIIDIIPAYQCLTIIFDPTHCSHKMLHSILSQNIDIVLKNPLNTKHKSKLIRIPVCYEERYSPDIEFLSDYTNLSIPEIVRRHTANHYLVHMLGFTPGFLYLGGLDPKLYCPRKDTPRTQIPAGAVGIGGRQTGIYPQATPGGWQIIGQTPLKLFQASNSSPFIADPLDEVEFFPITRQQFTTLAQVASNSTPRAITP
ncbi:5-oxoprolinase subunit PxpB [Microbulbifer sp. OS29]|uniref:5-oxoprolinase subunit PxpB n=1 Tax=Microbulbifer okhotskensis TaxID=2926617 RepID=A0A9X2J647_9GAMM|nr:5-oxoprolinase subunit PxpB [Microbulbifer okhotskensis]MCO1334260.1 5-oxoprolinase subunit PxpB [Microbulbifer okhotskensis]